VRLAALNGAAGFVHLICTIVGDNKYKFSPRYTNDDVGVEVLDLMWVTAILAQVVHFVAVVVVVNIILLHNGFADGMSTFRLLVF
jgi:hypothetical protein